MTKKQEDKIHQEGFDAFEPGVDAYTKNPYSKQIGGLLERRATPWFRGWKDAEGKYGAELIEPFLREFDELCKKYNVSASCGCGECGGSFYITEKINGKDVAFGEFGGEFPRE